jgi:hypothetical protein
MVMVDWRGEDSGHPADCAPNAGDGKPGGVMVTTPLLVTSTQLLCQPVVSLATCKVCVYLFVPKLIAN